jgi:hypothetical protein
MQETADDEEPNRQELKNKRNLLYTMFLKNPKYTRLAVDIKAIDDQLAEWSQRKSRKC